MTPEGVKTAESDKKVTLNYVQDHVHIGILSLQKIMSKDKTVKHLKW